MKFHFNLISALKIRTLSNAFYYLTKKNVD